MGACAALVAAWWLALPIGASAWTATGGTLPVAQRHFSVFDNFTDPSANDNLTPHPSWPGATGAPLAFWKGAIEWSSELHGDGGGDPHQPGDVGSGGADFDVRWAGLASGPGGANENVVSEIAGCSGGVLAFVESPTGDGWRMRFYSCWTWDDGPGAPVANAIDLQAVFTHEFGHVLGLGHSSVPGSTMAGGDPADPISMRSIEADDQAGVRSLYGALSPQKPHVDAALASGGSVTILGARFAATGNQVRFLGAAVPDAPATGGGMVITVPLPAGVLAGDVQVVVAPGLTGAQHSNPYPFDPAGCGVASTYCVAKPNSQGCLPSIASVGTPSASSPQPFAIGASALINQKTALLLYALAPAATPFQGGTLCLGGALRRTPAQSSGGNVGPDDCSGALTFDFNGRIQAGIDPALVAGALVYAQVYARDPADPFGVGLSDALAFRICP